MNTDVVLAMLGVVAAVFSLGAIAGWGWDRYRSAPGPELTSRRVSMALSVFFTLVAIMVAVDLIVVTSRFNEYVRQTLPRDAAQEQCDATTIDVLRIWARARISNEGAEQRRDDLHIGVLETLIRGEKVPPEKIDAFQNAIVATGEARQVLEQAYDEHPLPDCSPAER